MTHLKLEIYTTYAHDLKYENSYLKAARAEQ